MKKTVILLILFLFFIIGSVGKADESIDEDAFFSDPQTVVDNKDIVNTAGTDEMDTYSFGVSAELSSYMTYSQFRSETGITGEDVDNRTATLLGNLFLDARLKHGFKIFSNLETQYNMDEGETDSNVRELILDANINQKIFFKIGKQVLQWGRCYLWNPTDLINVEKKTFIQKTGYREGTKGIKAHIPFGTTWNIYGFLEAENTDCPDDYGRALKVEYLTGATEMAVSVWGKKDFKPVYGYDVSSRIGKIDVAGEWSVFHGSNEETLQEENGIISTGKKDDTWVHRFSINAGRSFDWGDQIDKITLTGEFFYNGDGYSDNLFKDKTLYLYQDPIELSGMVIPGGDKKTYLLANELYIPNYHSKHYVALFTIINKFLISDVVMHLNVIANLDDHSSILSTGATYKNIKDFSVGLTFYRFLGPEDAEYTFFGQRVAIQLVLGYAF